MQRRGTWALPRHTTSRAAPSPHHGTPPPTPACRCRCAPAAAPHTLRSSAWAGLRQRHVSKFVRLFRLFPALPSLPHPQQGSTKDSPTPFSHPRRWPQSWGSKTHPRTPFTLHPPETIGSVMGQRDPPLIALYPPEMMASVMPPRCSTSWITRSATARPTPTHTSPTRDDGFSHATQVLHLLYHALRLLLHGRGERLDVKGAAQGVGHLQASRAVGNVCLCQCVVCVNATQRWQSRRVLASEQGSEYAGLASGSSMGALQASCKQAAAWAAEGRWSACTRAAARICIRVCPYTLFQPTPAMRISTVGHIQTPGQLHQQNQHAGGSSGAPG